QPAGRLQIWPEKITVLLAAVVSTSLVYFLGWRSVLEQDIEWWFTVLGFLLATFGSGLFWTLVARSTLGGLILNMAVQGLILFLGIPISLNKAAHQFGAFAVVSSALV